MAYYLHKDQYPPYSRKSHDEPDGTAQLLYNDLASKVHHMITEPEEFFDWETDSRQGTLLKLRRWCLRRYSAIDTTKALLVVVWLLVLWWGERLVFRNSISACRWENWEPWVFVEAPSQSKTLTNCQP
jgi:hypothetical protein